MKNIQVIDSAVNCAYDIFAVTEEEFALIFPEQGQDIQFAEDLPSNELILKAFEKIWKRHVDKKTVQGIHGTLFYKLEEKKPFYPNLEDEDITKGRGRAVL